MSDRNMAVMPPCVQNAYGERNVNTLMIPFEFSEVASLCTATEDTIGGVMQLCIADHRNLHTGLGVGRDHTTWIKGRISEYGFVKGRDFEVFPEVGENSSGGRPAKVYRLSLPMAKELAMVEGNDMGKLVRRYFVWVEENARRVADAAVASVQSRQRAPRLLSPNAVFRDNLRTLKMLGFDTNQAALCANRATIAETGKDVLGAMGVTHLLAPRQEPHLNPTEVGAKLGQMTGCAPMKANAVNRLLERDGWQVADLDGPTRWQPTEKGKVYAVWTDTAKATKSGTAINQLRWREGIVKELVAAVTAGGSSSAKVA